MQPKQKIGNKKGVFKYEYKLYGNKIQSIISK